ncbi:MAG: hypothetical protein Q9157_005349 [Trypethelium eluteriae]
MMKCNSFLAILNLGAMVVAQTTDPTLQQASQILEGQVSVARAFTANPTVVSLFSAISTALPSDFSATPAYESIISQYSAASNGGIDVALLTSSVSVATQAWETLLPSSLKDAWDSFETSFISDVQMVEATPVGITPGATLSPSVTTDLQATQQVLLHPRLGEVPPWDLLVPALRAPAPAQVLRAIQVQDQQMFPGMQE